jgi:hypothetical protein
VPTVSRLNCSHDTLRGQTLLVNKAVLREHVAFILRRAPVEGLTFMEITRELNQDPKWATVTRDELRAALNDVVHSDKNIEQLPTGRYCSRES